MGKGLRPRRYLSKSRITDAFEYSLERVFLWIAIGVALFAVFTAPHKPGAAWGFVPLVVLLLHRPLDRVSEFLFGKPYNVPSRWSEDAKWTDELLLVCHIILGIAIAAPILIFYGALPAG